MKTSKTIRVQAEKLVWQVQHHFEDEEEFQDHIDAIEAFALEIEKETLERAAKRVEDKMSVLSCSKNAHGLPKLIRELANKEKK